MFKKIAMFDIVIMAILPMNAVFAQEDAQVSCTTVVARNINGDMTFRIEASHPFDTLWGFDRTEETAWASSFDENAHYVLWGDGVATATQNAFHWTIEGEEFRKAPSISWDDRSFYLKRDNRSNTAEIKLIWEGGNYAALDQIELRIVQANFTYGCEVDTRNHGG